MLIKRKPIIADTNLLVEAFERGNTTALAELRSGKTFITPNQFREFLNMTTGIQRKKRRNFLRRESVELIGGPYAGQIARLPDFRKIFSSVKTAQGRGDAALAAFGKATGFEAVTSEKRLYNFLIYTMGQLEVSIRRVY